MNATEIIGNNFEFSEEFPKYTNIDGFPEDDCPDPVIVLRKGDKGARVKDLQANLNDFVSTAFSFNEEKLLIDGFFGKKTEQALKNFQQKVGLVVDGVYGKKSHEILMDFVLHPFDKTHLLPLKSLFLSEQDYRNAADLLGVNQAVVRAVTEVESNGAGFLNAANLSGDTAHRAGIKIKQKYLPKILHERHVLYRILEKQKRLSECTHPKNIIKFPIVSLVYQKPGGYLGGNNEWLKHEYAIQAFGEETAVLCTSWGLFQIMGFNYLACGFDSALAFKFAMMESEWRHLEAFCNFVKNNPAMLGYLKVHDFANFAKLYNGPAYKKNLYDIKLQRAFEKYQQAGKE